jgi:cytidylate kinase
MSFPVIEPSRRPLASVERNESAETPRPIQPRTRPVRGRRVHVLGGEATGKTTVARRIGEILDCPVYNLDAVAWLIGDSEFEVLDPMYQPSASVEPRSIEECREIVVDIARQQAWVTEGKYLNWTAELFERADMIVFLDHVRPWTAIGRILRRAGRSALREASRQEGYRRFIRLKSYAVHSRELVVQLLHRIVFEFRPAPGIPSPEGEPSRAAMIATVRPYREKVVWVRRADGVDQLLESLAVRSADGGEHRSPDLPVGS